MQFEKVHKGRTKLTLVQGKETLIGKTQRGEIGLIPRDVDTSGFEVGQVVDAEVVWIGKRYFIFIPIPRRD